MRQHRGAARLAIIGLGFLGILAGLSGSGIMSAPPAARAQIVDAAALRRQQAEALNAGNVAAVMATFNDDATYQGTGLCAQAACVGRAAIQQEIERQVADHVQIATISRQVAGATSTGRVSMRSTSISAAGVARIIVIDNLEVKTYRFSKVQVSLDLSDHQTSQFRTATGGGAATGGSGGPGSVSVAPQPDSALATIRDATPIPPANTALTPIPAANATPPAANSVRAASIATPPAAIPAVQAQPQVRTASNAAAAPGAVQLPNVGSAGTEETVERGRWQTFAILLGGSILGAIGLLRRRRA